MSTEAWVDNTIHVYAHSQNLLLLGVLYLAQENGTRIVRPS